MIKYSWARYKGNPIHISEVNAEMRLADTFAHVETGKRMTAYLNGKFQRHFHHIESSLHESETYLHKTAKEVFRTTYENCLTNGIPFVLEFLTAGYCTQHFHRSEIKCEVGDCFAEFDLTQKFKHIVVEEQFDELRPDIQLLSKRDEKIEESIFVEISVTHKSTEKKIQRGKRIIEINIRNEDDILKLRSNKISFKTEHVTFHNFKKNPQEVNYCGKYEKGCRTSVNAFILYKSGAYVFLNETLENVVSHVASDEGNIAVADYSAFKKQYYGEMTETEKKHEYLRSLQYRNIHFKDCRFCRYKGDKIKRGTSEGLFCKFLKKDITFDSAFECNFFRKEVSSKQ